MVNKYIEKITQSGKIQIIQIISQEIHPCPICGGVLNYLSTRKRNIINPDGSITTLIIRRLKCANKNCKHRIHHELPTGYIVPYKRHCTETIEKVINGEVPKSVENEKRTIDRIKTWWNNVLPYFLNVLKSLTEKTGQVFGDPPKTAEIVRAAANSHNWIFTRSAVLPG